MLSYILSKLVIEYVSVSISVSTRACHIMSVTRESGVRLPDREFFLWCAANLIPSTQFMGCHFTHLKEATMILRIRLYWGGGLVCPATNTYQQIAQSSGSLLLICVRLPPLHHDRGKYDCLCRKSCFHVNHASHFNRIHILQVGESSGLLSRRP